MATVWIPALLRPLCGGDAKVKVTASTLDELLHAVDGLCPGIYERVVENGRLRPELAVAIDGEAESFPLWEKLKPEADVTILPAIGGG